MEEEAIKEAISGGGVGKCDLRHGYEDGLIGLRQLWIFTLAIFFLGLPDT